MRVLAAIVLVAALSHGARANTDEEPGAEPKLIPTGGSSKPAPPVEHGTPINYSHKGQVMASVRFGLGLRAIVPYEETTYCGETSDQTSNNNAAACLGRSPFSVDFELGYGITHKIDLLFELRVGIEADFDKNENGDDGPHVFHLSPGARFFFGETDKVKVFTTAQIVLDLSGYKGGNGADIGNDFGIRNLTGLWFDLDRAYGLYIYAGPTASFARWLRFELEGGFGIQGRYR